LDAASFCPTKKYVNMMTMQTLQFRRIYMFDLNSEVAYLIFASLQLEFDVRLTGLRSAAHLNGRQGVIRSQDPREHGRWKARLDDSTWVSVKAVNFEHIRRGDYRRRSL